MTIEEQARELYAILPQGRARSRTSTKKIATQLSKALEKVTFDQLKKATQDMVDDLGRQARNKGHDPGEYVQALERWIRDERYESFIPRDTPIERELKHGGWRIKAKGSVLKMLQAMSEQGCPDDVLDQLAGNIGVTNCNAERGMPTTAVYANSKAADVWHRAASGYAKRAGFNEHIYSKAYVEFVLNGPESVV